MEGCRLLTIHSTDHEHDDEYLGLFLFHDNSHGDGGDQDAWCHAYSSSQKDAVFDAPFRFSRASVVLFFVFSIAAIMSSMVVCVQSVSNGRTPISQWLNFGMGVMFLGFGISDCSSFFSWSSNAQLLQGCATSSIVRATTHVSGAMHRSLIREESSDPEVEEYRRDPRPWKWPEPEVREHPFP